MTPLIIAATGACTPMGTRSWQTASCLNAGLSAFTRKPISNHANHRATISVVSALEPTCVGVDRLIRLAAPALAEALFAPPSLIPLVRPIPIFMALPEPQNELPEYIDARRFALELPRSIDVSAEYLPITTFAGGPVAGADALAAAYRFMFEHAEAPEVIVGGVDSLTDQPLIDLFYQRDWLQVNGHCDGFIASEGAAFVRLARRPASKHYVTVYPPSFGIELSSRVNEQSMLTGAGLINAVTGALNAAQIPANALHGYWSDRDGSPWRGNELTSLSAKLSPDMPPERSIASFTGQLGATWVPLLLCLFDEMRQELHHPVVPRMLTGQAALFSVSALSERLASWIASWGYARHIHELEIK